MVERVMVGFEGNGSGVAELSWGQREMWGAMQRQRTWLPMGEIGPLPEGTTVADVADQLRFMMCRYQTLRTRLRLDPDGAKQVVSSSGEVALEVVDAPDDADVATFSWELKEDHLTRPYDFVTDWPMRMTVVRQAGVPRYLIAVMCHLVTDGFGTQIMLADLAKRDPATGGPGPVIAMEPVEQVRWQNSPAGERQNTAALGYAERVLRSMPARRFPVPAERYQPRHWAAIFTSPALYLAVHAIADRSQVDSPTAFLGVFAVAMARVTGINPTVVRVLVSNRFRPRLADSVSPVLHPSLCVIDVAGLTVAEVVAQAQGRTMAAYKHAYYDPTRMAELVARVGRDRGEEVDISCFFNDRRIRAREEAAGPTPTAEQIQAALPQTSFYWKVKQDVKQYEHFFLHIEDAPDTGTFRLYIDTHHTSPEAGEACLRTMEEVAVATVLDPTTPADAGDGAAP